MTNEQFKITDRCDTFEAASNCAKRLARQFYADVHVKRQGNTWAVLVPTEAIKYQKEFDAAYDEERFEESCKSDPHYEGDEPTRPVYGNDWSQV